MRNRKMLWLVLFLVLSAMLMTACSAGNPVGTWQLSGVKNDQTGEITSVVKIYEVAGVNVVAEITVDHVYIGAKDMLDFADFDYYLVGNSMVDPSDGSEVTYTVRGEKLTISFDDCDLVFTRVE